ncbi:Protein of unknown function [Sulfitobacter marinus]|uniref:DUF2783 domain-containing protein n=1 Tax=Sulfitobacter marinus TaxID=394264 RepID=A0A1I6VJA9_9RHOB|nr:DUF2783 domain-containing protein [Sulfitobacter marinus]SFT13711.1 Protein of unknown function [Sulfitobacter marinus]
MILDDTLGLDADSFYNALMDAHAGLTDAQSHALNARLVLIFANEIGDLDRLEHLLAAARQTTTP